jgi:hypothetical protein
MTLGNMRANDVRSLAVSCWQCHHRGILSAELWPDHVPMPASGPRMMCTGAGAARGGLNAFRPAALILSLSVLFCSHVRKSRRTAPRRLDGPPEGAQSVPRDAPGADARRTAQGPPLSSETAIP